MNTKEGLQQRIIQGRQNIERLSEMVDKLPKGKKQVELGEKSIRMLRSLCDLEYGFIELHPNVCLFGDRRCDNSGKGTFVCRSCLSYLNAGRKRLL